MNAGVDVAGVTHLYPGKPPVLALDDVSLRVPDGEILAVLGHSGSGKSSLLRVIAGFEVPAAGQVSLGSHVVVGDGINVPPNRRKVGIVPQEGGLFPHLDVAHNVGFGLRHLDRSARRARVGDLLDLVGLAGYEHRRPRELSGGQQQRVALARALAPEPDVVLLDEPFSALDAALRTSLRDDVASMLRSAGATAVLVTHDRSEAMAMADEIAVLTAGRVVQVGTPADLYHRPADQSTAELLGAVNVLVGVCSGGAITCALGRLDVAPGGSVDGDVRVLVRPESLVVVEPGHERGVKLTVIERRFSAGDVAAVLEASDGTRLSARWVGVDPPRPGEVVTVAVNTTPWVLPR